MRRHIVDMGITPGTEIKLVKLAPMGDPLEIELRGYTMSLRKADADSGTRMLSAQSPPKKSAPARSANTAPISATQTMPSINAQRS